VAGLALVLDDAGVLARRRGLVEAEDLHRRARRRLLHLLATEVEERAYLSPGVAGDDRVADAKGPAGQEHGGDRTTADVESALDDRPRALRLRIGLELELCVRDEQDLFEEVVEALAGLRRDVGELRGPSPLLRLQVVRDELLAHPLRVGLGLVDLVHGDEDRDFGRPRMVDGLDCLWHDAVVGRHHEHSDVRHLRSAGPQRGERLVARRVEERDPPAVVVDLVGADVLCDAAGLRLDDRALAQGVEQRRLPMVDVAHDRDHGRSGREIGRVVLVGLGLELLLVRVLDLDFALELCPDELDRVVGQRLRDRDHLADAHHDLDDLGHRHAERGRELLHRRPRVDRDGARRLGRRLLRRSLLLLTVARRPLGLARACSLGVDDHAALAAPSRRAAARSQRSLAISHGSSLFLRY
jgi:hypothetical protein